jgi:peptidoglycan/xylan/chitin deacetylase (PgdA/CDA1 family)
VSIARTASGRLAGGVVLSLLSVATAQAIDARIAKFDGDRPAAISYTFDDNLRDQFTLAVPMLDEVGFKGTFFVIAGKTAETPAVGEAKKEDGNVRNLWGGISWPELRQMADAGHEVASHTWSHASLTRLSPEEVDAQFAKACEAIQARVGRPALTVAFPGNGSNSQVQAAALKHHVAFRAYQQSTSGKSTVANLDAWADKQVKENDWGVLMVHGIAAGYAAMSDPEILRTHLKHMKSREAEIWVATFADVARYVRERDDAKVTVAAESSNGVTLTVSGTLDARYDVPLTIVLDVAGATSAEAKRGEETLPTRVDAKSIHVRAAPSTRPITVTWK